MQRKILEFFDHKQPMIDGFVMGSLLTGLGVPFVFTLSFVLIFAFLLFFNGGYSE